GVRPERGSCGEERLPRSDEIDELDQSRSSGSSAPTASWRATERSAWCGRDPLSRRSELRERVDDDRTGGLLGAAQEGLALLAGEPVVLDVHVCGWKGLGGRPGPEDFLELEETAGSAAIDVRLHR